MRVFAVSDLHMDYQENTDWLNSLSSSDYQKDVLIVAGDISDRIVLINHCFNQLAKRFHQVIYVPGNHDLWTKRESQINSLEKFKIKSIKWESDTAESKLELSYEFLVCLEKLRQSFLERRGR